MLAMSHLRVLQVISSSATSGAERHVNSLSRSLRGRGHHVEVVCAKGGWLPQQLRVNGIPVHEIDMNGRGWMRTAALIRKTIREGDFECVHSHLTRATYISAVAGLIGNFPLFATVHVSNRDLIYKRVARGRNKLIAVSDFVRGMLHGRGIADRFIETVHNGTDFLDEPSRNSSDVKSELHVPQERRLLGLVGRVCRDKGHLLLVSALPEVIRQHPDVHVVFVGRVEALFKKEIDTVIQETGVGEHVTFTGNRPDVSRLLDSFEFTVMPSRRETFGVAAIEAMASARPVVASRVGGLPEVVHHGETGLLFDLRVNEVSDAINYMLDHREECRQMGALGRDLVKDRFTLNHMVDRLESIYGRAKSAR